MELSLTAKQAEYVREGTRRWNFAVGAVRSGKSYLACVYTIPRLVMAGKGKKGINLILGATRETIERNVLTPMRDVYGQALVGDIRGTNITTLFGEKVYCIGAESRGQVSKIRGSEVKFCYIDEVCDVAEDVFEMLKSRLSLPYSECHAACNPQGPDHYVKQFIDTEGLDLFYQHYTIDDNPFLPAEYVAALKKEYEGTVLYDWYVMGEWRKANGLIFSTYEPLRHDLSAEEARRLLPTHPDHERGAEALVTFTAGLDTSYSAKSADTIAMTFGGITDKGRYILLDCKEYNNKDLREPLAPTDTVRNFVDFLDRNKETWGLARHCFIDSADQATITELRKWKRAHPESLYIFEDSHKKLKNIDRIELQLGWMGKSDPAFRIVAENCQPYVRELGVYSWDETKDSTPEDANDHCIQSCQYSWIPYRDRIGRD